MDALISNTMWYVIIGIVVIVLFKFFFDVNKMGKKVRREGGMSKKFEKLIEIIKSGDPRCKVFKEKKTYLIVGVASNAGGRTIFELTMTFSTVTIQYKTDSPIFGRHMLEWDFPVHMDQEEMAFQMFEDIEIYNKKLGKDFPGVAV